MHIYFSMNHLQDNLYPSIHPSYTQEFLTKPCQPNYLCHFLSKWILYRHLMPWSHLPLRSNQSYLRNSTDHLISKLPSWFCPLTPTIKMRQGSHKLQISLQQYSNYMLLLQSFRISLSSWVSCWEFMHKQQLTAYLGLSITYMYAGRQQS